MNSILAPFKPLPGTLREPHWVPRRREFSKHETRTFKTQDAMPRSLKRSITVPNPVRDGLLAQLQDGTLDYPSENAAWIGLARYQLLIGKPHPITVAIARMHPDDQDVIDDFLLEVASRGLSLRGQFLAHVVQRAVSGTADPNEQAVTEMVPGELLKMARAWRRDPDGVMAGLG